MLTIYRKIIVVCLYLSVQLWAVDTLNIVAIRVEFRQDAIDDQTTGNGKFDSGDNFDIDPKPHDITYFEKHLEFARNYFLKVSSGKLFVRYAVADTILQLDKQMRHYRMPSKKPTDTNNDYIKELNLGLMSFANDALRAASVANLLNIGSLKGVPIRRDSTLFLFFHAGASGLTDGGGLGALMADTPADLIDSYIWPEDFKYYHGETYDDRTSVTPPIKILFDTNTTDASQMGIYSADSSNFVNKFLMCSETASQDSLNFGINGIIVNQIARGMGLPDLWNTSTGMTAVGSFCLMDVGGYNAVYGFLPITPSAWCREYKRWSTVLTPPDTVTTQWTFDLPSIQIGDTIAKIPLSSSEYILLENRQWISLFDSVFSVKVYRPNIADLNSRDTTYLYSKEKIFDPFYGPTFRLLGDSICSDTPKCEVRLPNRDKLKGIITEASSYDLGLPGYGILAWHINDKTIRDNMLQNTINADVENRGVDLKEADGIEDVGAEYVHPLFGRVDDYGGPEDFYPYYNVNTKKFIAALTPFNGSDTFLRSITNSDRYENTATRAGGYTGITIRMDTIANAVTTREYNSRDSKIRLFATDRYRITVNWIQRQGDFPKFSSLHDTVRHIALIQSDSILVAMTENALISTMTPRGLNVTIDSSLKNASWVVTHKPAVYGPYLYWIGYRGTSDTLFVHRYTPATQTDTILALFPSVRASLHPLLVGLDSLVIGCSSGVIIKLTPFSTDTLNLNAPIRAVAGTRDDIVAIAGNRIVNIPFSLFTSSGNSQYKTMPIPATGSASVALGNFYPEKQGHEILIMDSTGTIFLLDASFNTLPGWPYKIDALSPPPPSIGDVNGDGSLDIIVAGINKIHALSKTAVPLTGWPYTVSWAGNSGQIAASPSLADIDGDRAQELFAALPGGRLVVIDNDGKTKAFVTSARQLDLSLPLGGTPVNNCIIANIDKDASPSIPEHIEIFALTKEGAIHGFNIPQHGNGKIAWATTYGNMQRQSFALEPDASLPTKTSVSIDTAFVFPNPVKGNNCYLRYKLSQEMKKVSIKIINAGGNIVYSQPSLPASSLWNQHQLTLKTLAPGFYTIRIEAASATGKTVRFANFGLVK